MSVTETKTLGVKTTRLLAKKTKVKADDRLSFLCR